MNADLFPKAQALYAAMKKKSKDNIFEGSMAEIYREAGASQTHYSKLFDSLVEAGCIEILRKGRAGLTSQIRLIRKPALPEFQKLYRKPLTRVDKGDILSLRERVVNLEAAAREGRIGTIDVSEALVNIETRLRKLEAGESNGKVT
jgi:hypothetical protein